MFTSFIDDDETVLWHGRPDANCYLKSQKELQRRILIGISLLLFMCLMLNIIIYKKTLSSDIFMLSFAIAVFVVFNSWANKHFKVPDWEYAVTDRRILFVGPGDTKTEVSQLTLEQIKKVYLQPQGSCISTIVFVPTFLAPNTGIKFYCVNEACDVKNLLLSLKSQG